ncbi:MAG: 2-hydroxy-6-oxononadienedioate/2-hydroxy-6-oxononatrienedioate hydrolase [Pseudomonadota bacterium]|jgi:pimeloyl-ACP methyl ester carboxylesterase
MSPTLPPAALQDLPLQRSMLPSGVELHWAAGGEGEPLVFVHGVMGDWMSWAQQWEAFSAHFHCVSYSRRYNYPNGNQQPSPDHSALVEAEDLLQLLDALQLDRVHLVASSYGAFTALALALAHPQRVRSIVAVEPAMLCYAPFSAAGRVALTSFHQQVVEPANEAFRRGDDSLGAALMTGGIHGANTPAVGGVALARRLQSARAMRMLALSSNEFPLLPPERLAALPMPVLLLSGCDTAPIHAEVFRNVCAAMPQASVAHVPAAGHGVSRDRPQVFNRLALEFLLRTR